MLYEEYVQKKYIHICVFLQQIKKMREEVKNLVLDNDKDEKEKNSLVTAQNSNGDSYFDSYDHFSIHHEMLTVNLK